MCSIHHWLDFTLSPSDDPRTIRIDEVRLMHAIVNKIKVSHVIFVFEQWLRVFDRVDHIKCIADKFDMLMIILILHINLMMQWGS